MFPVLLFAFAACAPKKEAELPPFDAAFVRLSPVEIASLPLATRFDQPMGGERGALTYDAQPFRVTRHMGSDLNGVGGWNSDLGDPVFASGDGRVIYSGVPGEGWGNVVIIAHRVPEPDASCGWRVYETMYAHMEKVLVKSGDTVKCAQQIGTVGTANGKYLAHLHFEVRRSQSVYPGTGYSDSALERVSPTEFIRTHQGAADDLLNAPP